MLILLITCLSCITPKSQINHPVNINQDTESWRAGKSFRDNRRSSLTCSMTNRANIEWGKTSTGEEQAFEMKSGSMNVFPLFVNYNNVAAEMMFSSFIISVLNIVLIMLLQQLCMWSMVPCVFHCMSSVTAPSVSRRGKLIHPTATAQRCTQAHSPICSMFPVVSSDCQLLQTTTSNREDV